VVAILGEHQTRTPWVVRVSSEAEGGASQPASATEEWETPTDDGSGWTGEEGTPPGSPSPPGPCALELVSGRFTPLTEVLGFVGWTGTCAHLTIAAGVSGPPVPIYSADVSQDENGIDSSPNVEVCDLPGGSDMPGTVVRFEAAMDDQPAVPDDLVLEDMGRGVAADVNSNPPPSSSVEAGQKIDLRAVGMLFAPALGIRSLKLFADGREIGTAGNSSGTTEPTPCDRGRFYAFLAGQHTVPDPAPPVTEICAVATTFEGHENRGCIHFFTGQVWSGNGSLTTSVVYPDGSTCTDAVDIAYTFGVAEDGTIAGTGLATHTQEAQCPFPIEAEQWETFALSVGGRLEGSTMTLEFAVAGEYEPAGGVDPGGFGPSLALGGGTVDLSVQGGSASGTAAFSVQSGDPPASYTASGPLTATCTSACDGG
jgi:hypothetical protein